MKMKTIYADNASTTPVEREVAYAMLDYQLSYIGNPSSRHTMGVDAAIAVDVARKTIAHALCGVDSDNLIFTSGATESNTWVRKIAQDNSMLWCTSAVEHSSVPKGTIIPVTPGGYVDVDEYTKLMSELLPSWNGDVLVSVMTVNNETGVCNDIRSLAEVNEKLEAKFGRKIYLHTDASQALGKIRLNVPIMGVDFITISAHKIGGPKGVGALFVSDRARSNLCIKSIFSGGEQENGLRAGTENVAGIVGFGKAVEFAENHREFNQKYIEYLENTLTKDFIKLGISFRVVGDTERRVPGIMTISFPGYSGDTLANILDTSGIFVSTGAACNSFRFTPSETLTAMGLSDRDASTTIRISLSSHNIEQEVHTIAEEIKDIIKCIDKSREV